MIQVCLRSSLVITARRMLSSLRRRRKRSQQVGEFVDWRRQHGRKVLKVRPVGSAGVRSRRCDHLRPLELIGKLLALLAGQQFLQARHILVGLVLDVVMQVFQKSVQEGHEFRFVDGHVLKLVKIILDLVVLHESVVNMGWEGRWV